MVDELTYNIRRKLFRDLSKSTVTIRHNTSQQAVPYRQLAAFCRDRRRWRRSALVQGPFPRGSDRTAHAQPLRKRYGKGFIPQDMIIQDFGVTYDELEPSSIRPKGLWHLRYRRSVKGRSSAKGAAATPLRRIVRTTSPAGTEKHRSAQLFEKAAREVGYHPTICRRRIPRTLHQPLRRADGTVQLLRLLQRLRLLHVFQSLAERQHPARAAPEKRFELRTNANVLKVNLTADKQRATGVTYVDGQGREMEQPADLVIVGAFQFHNVHLMLLSGIGKPYDPQTGEGVVGRNFAYQNMTTIKAILIRIPLPTRLSAPVVTVSGWMTLTPITSTMPRPALSAARRSGSTGPGPSLSPGYRFLRGRRHGAASGNRRLPIPTPIICRWTPTARTSPIARTISISTRTTKRLRPAAAALTFDWQENDIKMAQFMFDKMAPIAKAMKPKYLLGSPKNANSHFDTTSYQTTHMNGGAVMGEDPKTSAVNRYLQSWDVHNVFVIGASAFPQGPGL